MNGAGKSTMFKILMGKLKPSSGQVRLFGTDPWKNPAPYSRVGFVPENEKMYDWMTAHQFISTFARLNGLTRLESAKEADRVLDFVGLRDVAHKQIGRYSKGMRQRTKIAHALVNDPDLIIRTAGEKRLSNFLLWQSTYSELYFSDKMWPEFSVDCLKDALESYNLRTRKFGKLPNSTKKMFAK